MNEHAKFYCHSTSSLKPIITWSKINGQLPQPHYIKEKFIYFPQVKHDHAGKYICQAENDEGSVQEIVNLNVYGKI